MPLILGANSVSGYTVKNSLRFNDGSSDNLSRTPATATNRKTWTWSGWVKKVSNPATFTSLLEVGTGAAVYTTIAFNTSEQLVLASQDEGSGGVMNVISSAVLRDTSAWYHIVVAVDTTQSTASDRVKGWINGQQITSFSTASYPTQNRDTYVNNTNVHYIGRRFGGTYFNGYMSEIYLIDGQALTPSSFGETDTLSGIWIPKAFSGTYGTNGFALFFKNSASLGTDSSGNGNTFTVNNLTSVDQSTDTPTNNFTLLNPLNYSSSTRTYGEGNTAITASGSGDWNTALNNIGVRSGKWYAEFKINSVGSFSAIGVIYQPVPSPVNPSASLNFTFLVGEDSGSAGWRNNGDMPQGGTLSTYTTGDILMIAMDMDNRKLYFGKNGTWQNSGVPTSGATGTGSILTLTADQDYFFVISPRGGSTYCNFGNPAYSANSYTDGAGFGNFSYAVPAGYYSLNTKNLATFG